jgi:hypothetical protein
MSASTVPTLRSATAALHWNPEPTTAPRPNILEPLYQRWGHRWPRFLAALDHGVGHLYLSGQQLAEHVGVRAFGDLVQFDTRCFVTLSAPGEHQHGPLFECPRSASLNP